MNITSVHMFSVVFMLSWFLCAKPAFAGSKGDWMKLLSDTLPVCKLSIPGTHDSGANLWWLYVENSRCRYFLAIRIGHSCF